jgi:hypothetical protein
MRKTLLLSILAALVMTAPAFAGTIVVTVGLNQGGLSLQAPTATATATAPVQIPVTVTDARGTGAGWTLKLTSATPVTVTSITARCASGSTCTLPKSSASADGQTLLQVLPNTGMGVIQLTVTIAPLGANAASAPVTFSVTPADTRVFPDSSSSRS